MAAWHSPNWECGIGLRRILVGICRSPFRQREISRICLKSAAPSAPKCGRSVSSTETYLLAGWKKPIARCGSTGSIPGRRTHPKTPGHDPKFPISSNQTGLSPAPKQFLGRALKDSLPGCPCGRSAAARRGLPTICHPAPDSAGYYARRAAQAKMANGKKREIPSATQLAHLSGEISMNRRPRTTKSLITVKMVRLARPRIAGARSSSGRLATGR